MSQETPKEEFDRLRTEMDLGRPLYMMSREAAEKQHPNFWTYHDRDKFMTMIDARERMEGKVGSRTSAPEQSGRMHPAWTLSNEKLLAERGELGGGNHGQL